MICLKEIARMARTIGDFVWIGTMEEFTSLSSYDDKVLYIIVEENNEQ